MKLTVYENQKTYKTEYRGIYSINFENGKRYIGMSDRVKKRLWQHFKNRDNLKDILPVHRAMRIYSFEFELLEECSGSREEMSEREKYWIKFYNTYEDKTKGYNLTPGGDGSSTGIYNSSAKLNEQQLNEVYDKLINDKTKFIYQIAAEYNISPKAISDINNGKRYYNEFLQYPLRSDKYLPKAEKGINNHLAKFKTQEEIDSIYNDLEKSNLTLRELAKKYNVSYTTISKINRGLEYQKDNTNYPIRKEKRNLKLSYEDIDSVYDMLINTKESFKSIGQKYNVSKDTIIRLNNGKTYQKEGYLYPIRANKENNKAVSTILGPEE
jgi:uncharacterized protein YerC/predicted GIY-YIG superfamily endonuclease